MNENEFFLERKKKKIHLSWGNEPSHESWEGVSLIFAPGGSTNLPVYCRVNLEKNLLSLTLLHGPLALNTQSLSTCHPALSSPQPRTRTHGALKFRIWCYQYPQDRHSRGQIWEAMCSSPLRSGSNLRGWVLFQWSVQWVSPVSPQAAPH